MCGDAERIGLYGFGASAHLTAQIAIRQGAEVHVFTRSAQARRLALELGAASAADTDAPTPVPLDGAIVFAPAGEVVPMALRALDRGGPAPLGHPDQYGHADQVPPTSPSDTLDGRLTGLGGLTAPVTGPG